MRPTRPALVIAWAVALVTLARPAFAHGGSGAPADNVTSILVAADIGLFSWYAWRYFWPVVLIAIGAGLLLRQNSWRR